MEGWIAKRWQDGEGAGIPIDAIPPLHLRWLSPPRGRIYPLPNGAELKTIHPQTTGLKKHPGKPGCFAFKKKLILNTVGIYPTTVFQQSRSHTFICA